MKKVFFGGVFVMFFAASTVFAKAGIIYRNPRVYNVEYSFEMFPDPNKVDRSKDLKLWIPIPREWDSQKAVRIISVEPEPHSKYIDPEYGNPMLFWDFGKEPEKSSYEVKIRCRLEQYETYADIDPNQIGPYDKTSKDYILYTQSTHTISITDKVKELAKAAVGDEKNPYLQAKRIYEFIRENMYYRSGPNPRRTGCSVRSILETPLINKKTGEAHYVGHCFDQSMVIVDLFRAVGIPARNVVALWDYRPWIRIDPENPQATIELRERLIHGLTLSGRLGLIGHGWAEFYLPSYGWIPVDPSLGGFGHPNVNTRAIIITKGSDVQIDPNAVQEGNGSYRVILGPLRKGRTEFLSGPVFRASKIQSLKNEQFNYPDPFPADALAEYAAMLYPETEAEKNLALYRKRALRWIDQNTREHTDKIAALARAYEKEPRARYEHEAFICHMLRKVVGDEKFFEIVQDYTDLRVKSGQPISTARFQKIAEDVYGQPLGWFFKQWVGYRELPQLQFGTVDFSEDEEGWHVRGNVRQLNKSLFRLPVEVVLETEKTIEGKTMWIDGKNTEFEFQTTNRPKSVLIDPNNDILDMREIPPLLEACSYDEIAFCIITDQDKADWFGWKPLHFAAEAGQIDVVKYLIDTRDDVDSKNTRGETPLRFAASNGHLQVADLLIANGANVNTKDSSGYSPLSRAIWNKERDMVKLLVSKGADVNVTGEDDWTFLHYVVRNNDRELVELLLAHGAKLDVRDEDGRTALHYAAIQGYKEIVEYLFSKHVDVNVKDNKDQTPLQLAKEKEHTEIVDLMRKYGAKE